MVKIFNKDVTSNDLGGAVIKDEDLNFGNKDEVSLIVSGSGYLLT